MPRKLVFVGRSSAIHLIVIKSLQGGVQHRWSLVLRLLHLSEGVPKSIAHLCQAPKQACCTMTF